MGGRTALLSTGSLALGLLAAAIYLDTPTGRPDGSVATRVSPAGPQPSGRAVVDFPIAEVEQHQPREVPVDFRIDVLPVMFFLVAEAALGESEHAEGSESCLDEVVSGLPGDWRGGRSSGVWWSIADHACRAGLVSRLFDGFADLPRYFVSHPTSGGLSKIELRESARHLARSLQRVESTFRVLEYPAHETALERIRDRLSDELAEEPYLEVLSEDLGLDMYALEVRVHLVPTVNDLRGMAYAADDERFECFVGVEAGKPTMNLRVLLHEMIHVADDSTDDPGTVFNQVRRVADAGSSPWLFRTEGMIHGIMYAEVEHVLASIGRASDGFLVGLEMPCEVEWARRRWTSYLSGAVARQAAVEQMTSLAACSRTAAVWFDLFPGIMRSLFGA